MIFNIAKDELVNVLNIVSKGLASRSTLPILAGIYVSADQNTVTFQTTDLEISIKHVAPADVIEGGKAVIPGKLFSDIVKSLPDAAVKVESTQEQTKITCLESSFSLSSLNPSDFPYFPEIDASTILKLPADQLFEIIKRVGKAVSRDESRAVLEGILFTVEADKVQFTATDSYRLAIAHLMLDEQCLEPFSAIIPGKIFEDVARLAVGCDTITIGFSENQILFTFGQTVFVSRKIEGNYPNCMQLIPADHNVTIKMNTQTLITAIKRVSLLAQSHTPVRFQFLSDEQKAIISAKTQDVGGATETIEAQIEGDDIEIAFNHQYVLDGLSAIGDETLMELQTSLRPGIFKSIDDSYEYLYLAMPVHLG